jgi:predicted DNA-binding ribbon-helix-helix protein
MALEGDRKVLDLECHMWHSLDQVGIRRAAALVDTREGRYPPASGRS